MYKKEMEELMKIYEGDIESTQQDMDDYESHLIWYMRQYVEMYDRREETHTKLEELKEKQKKFNQNYIVVGGE